MSLDKTTIDLIREQQDKLDDAKQENLPRYADDLSMQFYELKQAVDNAMVAIRERLDELEANKQDETQDYYLLDGWSDELQELQDTYRNISDAIYNVGWVTSTTLGYPDEVIKQSRRELKLTKEDLFG